MVSINYATREVSCKIVYYGPGLSGKTTNLQYVHLKVPPNTKGKLISLATDADRTLYFDFLPINIGTINGFAAKFQLYTVPGQVYYNATRKLVLRGADGLVFVADSQPDKMDENIESLNNLKENLAEYGYNIDEVPVVIQYNKQDLPGVLSMEELRAALNPKGWPEFGASATEGFGVFDTLKCILKMVLDKAKTAGADVPKKGASERPAPVGQAPPVAQPMPQPVQQPMPQPIQQPQPAPPPPEPVYTQPVRQPVQPAPQPMAPAAQQTQAAPTYDTQEVSRPAQIQTSPPPLMSENEAYQREPVQPEPAPQQAYRPFPGNTVEQEHRMNALSQARSGQVSTMGRSYQSGASMSESAHPGRPQMAPSLKAAEKAEKPKKRSFFKRLFGLK